MYNAWAGTARERNETEGRKRRRREGKEKYKESWWRSFVRSSSCRGTCKRGEGRIRIFPRAWLNIISLVALSCTSGIGWNGRRDRVLSLFIENASRILSRLRTLNGGIHSPATGLPSGILLSFVLLPSSSSSRGSQSMPRSVWDGQRSSQRGETRAGIFVKRG